METVDRRSREDRRTRPRGTPDRRGRKPHEPMTFEKFARLGEDVARGEPRNITLRDLADLSGFSTDKLLQLRGYLKAFPSRRDIRCSTYLVTYVDAARLLRELRLIP